MTHGRNARRPHHIPLRGWWDIALRLKDRIAQDRIGLIAAGVAFFGLLALFPAISAMIAISGLLVDPTQVVDQLNGFANVVPQEVIEIISGQAREVASTRTGGLELTAVLSVIIAFYSASSGVASLIKGVNVAYDESEKRGFLKLKMLTFALTLFLMLGLLFALLATLALPAIFALIDLGSTTTVLVTSAFWAAMCTMTIIGLSVFYRYGPSRSAPKWSWASFGAVAGCVLWIAASAGFAFYVSKFGSYNESFGTIGGVVVLLLWFWISAFIVLLGAEMNAEIEAQTRIDTTVGPDAPMGSRDAVKADTLGAIVERGEGGK